MEIIAKRFVLRDFVPTDRAAFCAYQNDPRYLGLYDLVADGGVRALALFELFLDWQVEPRTHFQLGIFAPDGLTLLGTAGLRITQSDHERAILGIELAPQYWGRYRLALEVCAALLEHGFCQLGLSVISGETASGNRRVVKLAQWFGARIVNKRTGPDWMVRRGWQEVTWELSHEIWSGLEFK